MTRILRLPDVVKMTGLKRSTIYLHISQGIFPKPIPLGPRAVGWIVNEIELILEARISDKCNQEIVKLVERITLERFNPER